MSQHALHTHSIKELFNMFKWVLSHVLSKNTEYFWEIWRTRYHMDHMSHIIWPICYVSYCGCHIENRRLKLYKSYRERSMKSRQKSRFVQLFLILLRIQMLFLSRKRLTQQTCLSLILVEVLDWFWVRQKHGIYFHFHF